MPVRHSFMTKYRNAKFFQAPSHIRICGICLLGLACMRRQLSDIARVLDTVKLLSAYQIFDTTKTKCTILLIHTSPLFSEKSR